MPMKAADHSECNPHDCIHRADQMLEDKKAAEETEYYEKKLQAKLHTPEARGMAPVSGEGMPGAKRYPRTREERSALVIELEVELLHAREEQVANGDPMPLQEIRNVVGDALRLLEHKNEQYGNAWRKQGYMGNLARIQSKAERLKNLLWRDAGGNGYPLPANYTQDGETVADTLLDLINLSAMMAINWTEENRWG